MPTRARPVSPTALGLRAHKGGAVLVAVALDAGEPRLLLNTAIATHAPGDRLALEPYHVASELPRDATGRAAAEAAVAEGRRRQDALAAAALQGALDRLQAAGQSPGVAALLVNRAGWVTGLLDYSLEWPEHAAVAEGLAVRDALRSACRSCAIALAELDEKSLPDGAVAALDLAPAAIEAHLKTLGATAGKPWRKEQKLACLAAWLALVRRPDVTPTAS